MKKFLFLPILLLPLLVLSGCANKYPDEQDYSLNQDNIDIEAGRVNPEEGQQEALDNEILDESTALTQTYTNLDFSYKISYPTNWQAPVFKGAGNSNFEIHNIPDAYLVGQMESMLRNNASIFSIIVLNSLNDISFADYNTIDDVIKDEKFILPNGSTYKLSLVSLMEIGGKNLRVFKVESDNSQKYEFIYNGKHYSVIFYSGSESQYLLDLNVFENILLSSFILL